MKANYYRKQLETIRTEIYAKFRLMDETIEKNRVLIERLSKL